MNPRPLITVRDVLSSSRWYQAVLGLESAHGGEEYEQLVFEGRMVLQLHDWDLHDHPHLGDPVLPMGNGVLLWFQTNDFDKTVERIRKNKVKILEGPQVNTKANHREIWIEDLDGYVVVVACKPGDVG